MKLKFYARVVMAIVFSFSLILPFSLLNKVSAAPFVSSSNLFNMIHTTDHSVDPNGYNYAYAPSIIYDGGKYHMFYCSWPTIGQGRDGSDYIRYVTSTDGKNWSAPVIKLIVYNNYFTGGACDPSVVYFGGYYYMYFSSQFNPDPGNLGPLAVQTDVKVARSKTIDGDYQVYTQDNKWVSDPTNPSVTMNAKSIILPHKLITQKPRGYGAGEQVVIAKDNKLYMWVSDDSDGGYKADNSYSLNTYMLTTTDPVNWNYSTGATKINYPGYVISEEIRWDKNINQFVMLNIANTMQINSYLQVSYSKDGLNWDTPYTIYDANNFPNFAHDIGISSDRTGTLLAGNNLVGFGAPRDPNATTNVWGQWDLWGFNLNLSPTGVFDSADCNSLNGWAWDQKSPNVPLKIHLYYIVNSSPQTLYNTEFTANNLRSDVISVTNDNGMHGFTIPTPSLFKDNRTYTIYAYAINPKTDGPNPLLTNSPIKIKCSPTSSTPIPTATPVPPTNTPVPTSTPAPTPTATPIPNNYAPTGFLDVATCSYVSGWTWDQDTPNVSIQTHVYADGGAGVGTIIGAVTANQYRSDVQSKVTHDNGLHGYTYYFPQAYHDGKTHKFWTYGIDSSGQNTNTELNNSGQLVTPVCN